MPVAFRHHSAGYRALLRSPGVLADLTRRGHNVAAAVPAEDGHTNGIGIVPEIGRNRARVSIITVTPRARASEAKNRTLTKAIDAGRQ